MDEGPPAGWEGTNDRALAPCGFSATSALTCAPAGSVVRRLYTDF